MIKIILPATICFHLKKLKELGINQQALIKNGMIQRLDEGNWMKRNPRGTEIFYKFKSKEIELYIINLIITHYKIYKILPNDPLIKHFIEFNLEPFTNINLIKICLILPSDHIKTL